MEGRRTGRPRSLIVRILRCDANDWQGQLVDVASGAIYPFASFLQLQRLMLGLVGTETVRNTESLGEPSAVRILTMSAS